MQTECVPNGLIDQRFYSKFEFKQIDATALRIG